MSQKPYTFGKKTMHFHTLATILQVRKKHHSIQPNQQHL